MKSVDQRPSLLIIEIFFIRRFDADFLVEQISLHVLRLVRNLVITGQTS